jgi:hypothetical protein
VRARIDGHHDAAGEGRKNAEDRRDSEVTTEADSQEDIEQGPIREAVVPPIAAWEEVGNTSGTTGMITGCTGSARRRRARHDGGFVMADP